MICAICEKPVHRVIAGYGLCAFHAGSLEACIGLDIQSPVSWYRDHRREHLERRGVVVGW